MAPVLSIRLFRRSPLAAGLLGIALLVSGCVADTVPPPDPPPQPPAPDPAPLVDQAKGTQVGLLLPLSGPAEALGQDMLDAAQLALFDVGESDVVLLPRDTAGSPGQARSSADNVIEEGARMILGPLYADAVAAVSPIAEEAGLPVLAFSNVSRVAEPNGTYLLGFRPEEQVERVVGHALSNGLQRIAGLAPDDAYGRLVMASLETAMNEAGGELGSILFYPPNDDPSAVVRQIADYEARRLNLERERSALEGIGDEASREALRALEQLDTLGDPPFDAILIADGSNRLRSVASLLTFYDVDPALVRFLGTMRWQDDPQVLTETALQGGWFAGPSPVELGAFEERFERFYGRPPDPLSSLAYDATALAVIVARDLGDPLYGEASLTNAEGFAGASGLFRLVRGGLGEHGLAVLEVRNGTASAIDPAPESFVDELALR